MGEITPREFNTRIVTTSATDRNTRMVRALTVLLSSCFFRLIILIKAYPNDKSIAAKVITIIDFAIKESDMADTSGLNDSIMGV